MPTLFSHSELEAIARALGDTKEGLTAREIEHLLALCKIDDVHPDATKWIRIHNALVNDQNKRGDRSHVLGFIRKSLKPARFIQAPDRFERIRAVANQALAFSGLAVTEEGELVEVEQARTISAAQRRADELRAALTNRGVHPDVLAFCRQELVADNYFHAVLEATKSIFAKLRDRTGLSDDGAVLVDRALAGDPPMLAINALATENEKSEQRGFANLVRGTAGMFRNPTAHAPRLQWAITKEDAADLLSLASLIHRRLDAAHMPRRI